MRVKVSRRTARSSGSSRLCSRGRLRRTRARPAATLTSGIVDRLLVSALSGKAFSRQFAPFTPSGLAKYFNFREEEADLASGIFERIRTVHRIRLDRFG